MALAKLPKPAFSEEAEPNTPDDPGLEKEGAAPKPVPPPKEGLDPKVGLVFPKPPDPKAELPKVGVPPNVGAAPKPGEIPGVVDTPKPVEETPLREPDEKPPGALLKDEPIPNVPKELLPPLPNREFCSVFSDPNVWVAEPKTFCLAFSSDGFPPRPKPSPEPPNRDATGPVCPNPKLLALDVGCPKTEPVWLATGVEV